MAYEGLPHICICGTITWGERVSGMWGPPSLSPCDCATWGKYEGNPHMPYEVHFSHNKKILRGFLLKVRGVTGIMIWRARSSAPIGSGRRHIILPQPFV